LVYQKLYQVDAGAILSLANHCLAIADNKTFLMNKAHIQRWRSITQVGFFSLFIVAPPLNIFRYDLTLGHFILFGHSWTLQLDSLAGSNASLNVLLYGLLPVVSFAAIFLFIAWRWGRIYCGWFCPHFSVVEVINKLMIRALGKASIWDKNKLPKKTTFLFF